MDRYTYKIGLPLLGAHDVVKRELHVNINGVEEVHLIEDMELTHWELVLTENAEVMIWLVDIDDSDNRSPAGQMLSFVVVDVVPPSAPEAPVISDVLVYEEPVVEEPVLEEPVLEEPVLEEEAPVEEPVMEEPIMEPPVEEKPAE